MNWRLLGGNGLYLLCVYVRDSFPLPSYTQVPAQHRTAIPAFRSVTSHTPPPSCFDCSLPLCYHGYPLICFTATTSYMHNDTHLCLNHGHLLMMPTCSLPQLPLNNAHHALLQPPLIMPTRALPYLPNDAHPCLTTATLNDAHPCLTLAT